MKKVVILNNTPKLLFSFHEREVVVHENMAIEDAETIAAQYPGQYVAVIDEPEKKSESEA